LVIVSGLTVIKGLSKDGWVTVPEIESDPTEHDAVMVKVPGLVVCPQKVIWAVALADQITEMTATPSAGARVRRRNAVQRPIIDLRVNWPGNRCTHDIPAVRSNELRIFIIFPLSELTVHPGACSTEMGISAPKPGSVAVCWRPGSSTLAKISNRFEPRALRERHSQNSVRHRNFSQSLFWLDPGRSSAADRHCYLQPAATATCQMGPFYERNRDYVLPSRIGRV